MYSLALLVSVALAAFGVGSLVGHAIGYGRGARSSFYRGRVTGLRFALTQLGTKSAPLAKKAIRDEEDRTRGYH